MAIKFENSRERIAKNIQHEPVPAPQPVPELSSVDSNFTRYIGYDDAENFKEFLTGIYAGTKTNGIFFDKHISNPASPEVAKITASCDIPADITREAMGDIVKKLQNSSVIDFSKIGQSKNIDECTDIFFQVTEKVKSLSPSPNAVRNVLMKFLCWIKRYNSSTIDNILYIGSIQKHEVYWLYLMSLLGCRVSYVNYTDETEYRSGDPDGIFSSLVKGSVMQPLDINLGKINIAQYTQQCRANEQLNDIVNAGTPLMIKYMPTEHEYIFKDMLTTLDLRRAKLICTDTTIPVYFTAYIGLDDETTYQNSLFTAKEELTAQNKQFILLTELRKPSYQEAEKFYSISKTNDASMIKQFTEKIEIKDNIGRSVLAKKAFIETLNSIQSNNLYNTAVQLAVWFDFVTSHFDFYKNDIPMIVYYGHITPVELHFLNMMSKTGIDIFYFNPDKSILQLVKSAGFPDLNIIERKDSQSGMPFPEKMIKTKLATTAYDAERSLDSIMYSDNTMFRTHQYSYSRNQTLKTTYEELGLMWHQQAMFRTGFDSKNDYVIVPNIFAKISGIPKGDVPAYYKDIAFKLSPQSAYFYKVPFFKPVSAVNRTGALKVTHGTKIDIDALKASNLNKYNYMTDNIQYLIFSKMQEVIDSGFIMVPDSDIVPLVLTAGLNIPNNILQIIQQFDFTKDIPKIVIVSNGKKTFEAFECILLVLLNAIGFDIIVYTPTGYKNLETFIRSEAFQEFNHGEYKYDFVPQKLKLPSEIPQEKQSLFERIFKGKK